MGGEGVEEEKSMKLVEAGMMRGWLMLGLWVLLSQSQNCLWVLLSRPTKDMMEEEELFQFPQTVASSEVVELFIFSPSKS